LYKYNMAAPEPSAGTQSIITFALFDRRLTPEDTSALSPTLNSNNPFRKSPLPSPSPGPQSAPARPSSTNPFLAAFETDVQAKPTEMEPQGSPQKAAIADDAKELFVS
jgi:hypothetical protein